MKVSMVKGSNGDVAFRIQSYWSWYFQTQVKGEKCGQASERGKTRKPSLMFWELRGVVRMTCSESEHSALVIFFPFCRKRRNVQILVFQSWCNWGCRVFGWVAIKNKGGVKMSETLDSLVSGMLRWLPLSSRKSSLMFWERHWLAQGIVKTWKT